MPHEDVSERLDVYKLKFRHYHSNLHAQLEPNVAVHKTFTKLSKSKMGHNLQ